MSSVSDKEILGLITVVPTMGNPYKINISRLIFGNNYYEAGQQLVEFVIARYGARGAVSFCVMVDDHTRRTFAAFLARVRFPALCKRKPMENRKFSIR